MITTNAHAQRLYTIDLPLAEEPVVHGGLDLGGSNPQGEEITANNRYLERGGRPYYPVVGEFHFSRFPADRWEEAIRKMKAGGITVVATYVFWNLHEREQGHFDWSGNLDLRRFVELGAQCGVDVIVRLGPFCHGEIRNGGLPDWLYGRAFEVRSNDPGYLQYVDRLYGEIAAQIRGLLYKDGGPVIGVQLENEYQHSAAPWEVTYAGAPREFTAAERDLGVTHAGVSASAVDNPYAAYGQDHMTVLKQLARKHGVDVPLYTATGWGNAAIVPRGSVPVSAAYAYPFWAPAAPSPFYLFTDLRLKPDYAPVSYDPAQYPSIAAEIGPGIMPTYTRRPRVPPESVAPLMVRLMGSGSNGIGYYMYHGGSTPVFDHFYSEESGGLPKINYDFQAPIGEFGQLRPHYHELKLLHAFVASFGDVLAPMTTTLPAGNAVIKPEDTDTLRFAVRSARSQGFVFMHNFQDHVVTRDLTDLRLAVRVGTDEITFPARGTFTLPSGSAAILPFNLDLGGLKLRSATVQPLTRLNAADGAVHYIFFSIPGLRPELAFGDAPTVVAPGCEVETRDSLTFVRGEAGRVFHIEVGAWRILVVPQSVAREMWTIDGERIAFSEAAIVADQGHWRVFAGNREFVDVNVYPAANGTPHVSGAKLEASAPLHSGMSAFRLRFPADEAPFAVEEIGRRKYRVKATGEWNERQDVMMTIDYVGDRCMAFFDGELVADHFYYGQPWEIGLRKFRSRFPAQEMILLFHPVHRDHTFLSDLEASAQPPFKDGEKTYLHVNDITFATHHEANVILP